jgi:hypothetical protein
MPIHRAKAEAILAASAIHMGALDAKAQEQICAALTLDLRTASGRGASTEDRLAALEAHTRHLQESVLELCRTLGREQASISK